MAHRKPHQISFDSMYHESYVMNLKRICLLVVCHKKTVQNLLYYVQIRFWNLECHNSAVRLLPGQYYFDVILEHHNLLLFYLESYKHLLASVVEQSENIKKCLG